MASVVSGVSGRRALVANLLLLGFLGAFAWLEASHPNAYYRSVREDQALESASFWSFFIAGGVFTLAAWRQRQTTGAVPWFLGGVAMFWIHSAYPWKFTGEVIECALGLGFLFAAVANSATFSGGARRRLAQANGKPDHPHRSTRVLNCMVGHRTGKAVIPPTSHSQGPKPRP